MTSHSGLCCVCLGHAGWFQQAEQGCYHPAWARMSMSLCELCHQTTGETLSLCIDRTDCHILTPVSISNLPEQANIKTERKYFALLIFPC